MFKGLCVTAHGLGFKVEGIGFRLWLPSLGGRFMTTPAP